jgi:hypothetical protein
MAKVPIAADIKMTRPTVDPLCLDRAIQLAEAELAALRRWVDVDPRTPWRREAAARLRWIADLIEVSR